LDAHFAGSQIVFDNKIEIFTAAAAIIGGISMPPGLPQLVGGWVVDGCCIA